MLSQHKGPNYFQAEGTTFKKKKLHVNSNSNTFQRKQEYIQWTGEL